MALMQGPDMFAGRIRPLTRSEYDRMVDMGLFVDEKVELIKGFIVVLGAGLTAFFFWRGV